MTIPLTRAQEQVDNANEAQIISFLSRVIGWETNVNDPAQIRRKIDAQDTLNALVFADEANRNGARDRARKFLHSLANQAAARDGF